PSEHPRCSSLGGGTPFTIKSTLSRLRVAPQPIVVNIELSITRQPAELSMPRRDLPHVPVEILDTPVSEVGHGRRGLCAAWARASRSPDSKNPGRPKGLGP